MMEQVAKVVDSQSGWVTLEVEMQSACHHCSSGEDCGTAVVAKAFSNKSQQFSIPSDRVYAIDDLVKLGLPESVVLKAAALIYLAPLAGLLFGGLAAQTLGADLSYGQDLSTVLSAFLGGTLGWLFGKYSATQLEKKAQPVILAYLGKAISL